jgi:hypothetical protein
MPLKTGKNKGQLSVVEIRKVIVSHNKLSKISIPPKTKREGLIKLIQSNGYHLDHQNQKLVSRPRPKLPRRDKKDIVKQRRGSALKKESRPKKKLTFKKNGVKKKEYVLSAKEKKEKIKASDEAHERKEENYRLREVIKQEKEEWDMSD